ncbi:MAG TPA: GNAT family N-acetyltransferase, partial [Methylocella sp.]|nr:GNAT family N-acetyltransferase [Methylocella sp.]
SALVEAIEKLAAARGTASLATDASDTAKPLFEARGYQATHRNTIEIDGEYLGNTRMTKALAPKAAPDGRP